MELSALHKTHPAFTDQDSSLYFALGLVRGAAEYGRMIESAASVPATLPDQPPEAAAEEFALFLLGVLAFARRIGRATAAAAAQAPLEQAQSTATASGERAAAAPVIRELLR